MSDSSQHDGPAPPAGLDARLPQRGNDSAGVIDVRWAQQRYAHATDWVASRFAVLGSVNTRYGTVDPHAASPSAALPIVPGNFARREFDAPAGESPAGDSSPRTTGNRPPTQTGEARAPEISAPSTAAEILAPSANAGGARQAVNASAKSVNVKTSETSAPVVNRSAAPDAGNTQSAPLIQRRPATPSQAVAVESSTAEQPRAGSGQTAGEESQRASSLDSQTNLPLESRSASSLETSAQSHATLERTPHADAEGEAPSSSSTTSPEQSRLQATGEAVSMPLRETPPAISRAAREESKPLAKETSTLPSLRETSAPLARQASETLARQSSEPSAGHAETIEGNLPAPASPALVADETHGEQDVRVAEDASGAEGVLGQEHARGAESLTNSSLPLAGTQTSPERSRRHAQTTTQAIANTSHAGEASPSSRGNEASSAARVNETSSPVRVVGAPSPGGVGDAPMLSREVAASSTEATVRMEWARPADEGAAQGVEQNAGEQAGAEHSTGQSQPPVSSPQADAPASAPPTTRPATAPEVPQGGLQLSAERMVWRKNGGGTYHDDGRSASAWPSGGQFSPSAQNLAGSASSSYGADAGLYRADAGSFNESVARNGDGGGGASNGSAHSNGGGVSLEQITEHVSRVLFRRVSVERERRGIGRWL